jgi:hypothetical protein
MIQALVDFSLKNRLLVLAVAVLLFIWGIISFRSLPVEAYPDVANNYVQVITQWPGYFGRTGGTAGYHSARNRDERNPPFAVLAIRLPVRPFQSHADFRR